MLILRLLLAAVLAEPGAGRADTLARQPEVGVDPRNEAARLLGVVLAGEPRIEAVQRAAEARAAASRDDVGGWRRRTRLAALVPRLVAEYRHDERSVHMVGLTSGSEVDYLRSSPGDTVSFRLLFDLDGLVFGRQELAVVAAAERADTRRRAAVERATRLYYERLRSRLSLLASPPTSARDRAALEIDLEAVTADLDALTGLYGEGAGEGAGKGAR
jgi:hypothetical protein